MTPALRLVVLAWACLWWAGCSLVKLSDDIVIGTCEDDADCDVLNDRSDPDFDPCHLWQCNERDKRCEVGPLDADDDGFTPAFAELEDEEVACQPEGPADCNDESSLAAPDQEERCDGDDNDCDGMADEGVLDAFAQPVINFQGENSANLLSVAYSVDPESQATAVAYAIDRQGGVPGLSRVPAALDELAIARALQAPQEAGSLRAAHLGVASMEGQALALALVNLSGVTRTVPALSVEPTAPSDIAVDADLAKYGLSCPPAEACAENAGAPEAAVAAPPTLGVSVAALGDRVLVTYMRADEADLAACEDATDAADQPRLVASLTRRQGGVLVEVEGASPLALGDSADAAPAAALGVPPLEPESGEPVDVGFLLARVKPNGRLALERLWEDGALQRETLLDLAAAPAFQPSLALGASEPGRRHLAVAHRRGCGVDSRILVHRVELSLDEDGALQAERAGEPHTLHDGTSQSAPSVAFASPGATDVWAVAYRDPRGLRARLLETDGTVRNRGEDPYLLIERQSGAVDLSLRPHLMAGATPGTWFTALSPVERPEAEMPRTIDAVELACP